MSRCPSWACGISCQRVWPRSAPWPLPSPWLRVLWLWRHTRPDPNSCGNRYQKPLHRRRSYSLNQTWRAKEEEKAREDDVKKESLQTVRFRRDTKIAKAAARQGSTGAKIRISQPHRGAAVEDDFSNSIRNLHVVIEIRMLYLVGLGLSDETDITVKGLEVVKKASRVYLEAYTSILLVDQSVLVCILANSSDDVSCKEES